MEIVKKVLYRNSSIGEIVPYIVFGDDMSILFSSLSELKEKQLGIDAEFEYTEAGDEIQVKVFTVSDNYGDYPVVCSYCNTAITDNFCSNLICSCRSRSHLLLMISTIVNIVSFSSKVSFETINSFLDNYIVEGEQVAINNIGEFFTLYAVNTVKNNRARFTQWENQELFKLDVTIGEFFNSNIQLSNTDFWRIANLPAINKDDFSDLSNCSLEAAINNNSNLSDNTIKIIVNNIDFLTTLRSGIQKLSSIKWK